MSDAKGVQRIVIRVPKGASVSVDDVKDLLVAAGFDPDEVEVVVVEEGEPDFNLEDCLIVLLDADATSEYEEELIEQAVRAGVCSVVGVWAPGQEAEDIHPVMRRYGSAQVPWDPNEVRRVIIQDEHSDFQNPDGEGAKPQKVKPNIC